MGPVCVTVPNFVKMVIRLQRCGDLTIFRMAVFCRLGFLKFKFLTIWVVKSHFALSCQISQRSNSPLLRCRDFCNFSMAGDCHLGFQKCEILTQSIVQGRYMSPCQISSKSVKQLGRYGNLIVFKIWLPPSSIFEIQIFYRSGQLRVTFYISMPNFFKICQTVAEI